MIHYVDLENKNEGIYQTWTKKYLKQTLNFNKEDNKLLLGFLEQWKLQRRFQNEIVEYQEYMPGIKRQDEIPKMNHLCSKNPNHIHSRNHDLRTYVHNISQEIPPWLKFWLCQCNWHVRRPCYSLERWI